MRDKQILIASILKPVNDTRMVEKLGFSLGKINGFTINIAGFTGKIPSNTSFVYHPLYDFDRLNILKRAGAPFKYLKLLRKLRPQLIIIETHELLLASVVYKLFHRTTLIYDVRENYYLNIRYGTGFKKGLRWLIAGWVRFIETITASSISHFILAEEVYSVQLPFTRNKSTYIPNAFNSVTAARGQESINPFQLLFTGTIAIETGIMEVLSLIKVLNVIDYRYKLKILGHCSCPRLFRELVQQSSTFSFIEISEKKDHVPHPLILEEISRSGFGFVHYHELPQIEGKIATKIFEYVGNSLPIILLKNDAICNYLDPIVDFVHLSEISPVEARKILEFVASGPVKIPEEVFWHYYESRYLELIRKFTDFAST